jgi:catechol 2,3-dioxygenase-like lactoylglutathione lyase family enzyme
MYLGIHHPGIGVRDMKISLRFYRDLLGLEILRDLEFEGPVLDDIVGLKNVKVRIVALKCGDDEVELFQYDKPATSSFPKDYRQCDGGIIHVAFLVDNLVELSEKLEKNGVKLNSKPYNLGGELCVYLRDPDGITIELLQKEVDP